MMTEERKTEKTPQNHNHEAKDRRAEHLFASFFREEIASVETPPLLPAHRTSRRAAPETNTAPGTSPATIPSPGSTKKPAPALLPDLLFAAAVFVMLTISLQNPIYSLRSPLAEAGIDFARDQRIGYHLEKSLAAFHDAAAPVFQNNNFRTKEFHSKGAPK